MPQRCGAEVFLQPFRAVLIQELLRRDLCCSGSSVVFRLRRSSFLFRLDCIIEVCHKNSGKGNKEDQTDPQSAERYDQPYAAEKETVKKEFEFVTFHQESTFLHTLFDGKIFFIQHDVNGHGIGKLCNDPRNDQKQGKRNTIRNMRIEPHNILK